MGLEGPFIQHNFGGGYRKNEVEWTGKSGMTNAEFLAVGKAYEAVFWRAAVVKEEIRSLAKRTSISASAVPAIPPGLSGLEKVPSVSEADLVRVLILCSDSTEQAAGSVCGRFEHFRVAVKAVVKNRTGSFLPFTVMGQNETVTVTRFFFSDHS